MQFININYLWSNYVYLQNWTKHAHDFELNEIMFSNFVIRLGFGCGFRAWTPQYYEANKHYQAAYFIFFFSCGIVYHSIRTPGAPFTNMV